MNKANTTQPKLTSRLFWPLVFGLGLTVGLICALSNNSVAERQDVSGGFTIDLTLDAIWGKIQPGDAVTVSRSSDAAYGAAETDGVGFFWTPLWMSSGRPADLAPGDTIEIYVNGALDTTVTPNPITGQVDVLNDQVTGNVAGVSAGTAVTVTMGDHGARVTNVPYLVTTVNGSGDYVADFGGLVDIGPHHMAQVQYVEANGAVVQTHAYPEQVFSVQNWSAVLGYANPSTAVTVTVYSSYPGSVRLSDSTTAQPPHGTYRVEANIEYGDVVEVDLGGGTLLSVTTDLLQVHPDAALDRITGLAPAAAPVRGYVWQDVDGAYDQDTTVADGSGAFTLTLGADLTTRDWPYVAYADADGDEVGYSTPPAHIRAYPDWSFAFAIADGPNETVTYTLQSGGETTVVSGQCGKTNSCDQANFAALAAGDVLTAELPSRTMRMTVPDFTVGIDTTGDQVVGGIDIAGWVDVYAYQWGDALYPVHGGSAAGGAVMPPTYAIALDGFDVRDGMGLVWAAHYDGIAANRTIALKNMNQLPYFQAIVGDVVEGATPQAGEAVTATLYSETGLPLATSSDDEDSDPYGFRLRFDAARIEAGRWVTVTSQSGWTAGLRVPELTLNADAETDTVWGEGPKALVMVTHGWNDGQSWAERFVPVDGYALDRGYDGVDLQWGDDLNVTYQAPNGNKVTTYLLWPWSYVSYDRDEAGSAYIIGHSFSVTVTDSGGTIKATATDTTSTGGAGPDGGWGDGFTVEQGEWSPSEPDIAPADWVHFQADDGYTSTIRVGEITGAVDVGANSVSGTIHAPWFADQTLQGVTGAWGFTFREFTVTLDAWGSGSYLVDYGPDQLQEGYDIVVQYQEPDGDRVGCHFRALEPDLEMDVNYGHDWVEGSYETGHTVWITVTQSDQTTIKGTAVLTTGLVPWWDTRTGFSTNWQGWSGDRPDIQPDDWVFGRVDNGYTSTVRIGTITGYVDAINDTITGTVDAAWVGQEVWVWCHPWGAPAGVEGRGVYVFPDGTDVYTCYWDRQTEWDVQPGQTIGVSYNEPVGDQVFNAFEAPWKVFLPVVLRNR